MPAEYGTPVHMLEFLVAPAKGPGKHFVEVRERCYVEVLSQSYRFASLKRLQRSIDSSHLKDMLGCDRIAGNAARPAFTLDQEPYHPSRIQACSVPRESSVGARECPS